MKSLSKVHAEAVLMAKTEHEKVKAAAVAMVERPVEMIRAILLKHEQAVIEVMSDLAKERDTLRTAIKQAEKQEPVAYDKTEINCFAQNLYDQKMREGRHGHYESMFHVIHQCIKKVAPPHLKPLTEEQMFELAEIAWRHGWASCRDAEYVGEEAEDERWGMVGAEVVQDIAAHGIKGDA